MLRARSLFAREGGGTGKTGGHDFLNTRRGDNFFFFCGVQNLGKN